MTTNWGPTSDQPNLPLANSFLIGCTVNRRLHDHNRSTQETETFNKIKTYEETSNDIGLGDIVVSVNDSKMKALMGPLNGVLGDSRSFGKPLVTGQSGNLRTNIPDSFWQTEYAKQLTQDEKNDIKRQAILSYLVHMGISIDQYRGTPGQDQTPLQDGIAVVMTGPITVKNLHTGVALPTGAALVLDLCPESMTGRKGQYRYQSDGPERYPFTYRPHDPHTPVTWVQRGLRMLADRTKDATIPNFIAAVGSANGNIGENSFVDETHRNSYHVAMGIVGLVNRVMNHVKTTTRTDSIDAGLYYLNLHMGLGGPGGDNAHTKSLLDVMAGIGPIIASDPKIVQVQQSALSLLLMGVQDFAAVSNRIVAKNVQTQLSRKSKSNNGHFDNDVWLY